MSDPLASIGDRFTAQFIDSLVGAAVGAVFYFAAQFLDLPLEMTFIGWILYKQSYSDYQTERSQPRKPER